MISKFSKLHDNGVITGLADSLCLLCETYLTKNELEEHIKTESHQSILESSDYLDKYKDDRIRKVKRGYYCGSCNLIILTLPKVDIHINSSTHVTNRNYYLIVEVDGGVIVFDDILINKQAWNGQKNGSCYICNTEYSDDDDHCKESSHILNVIQSKLELERNKYVYRKVDDSFLNCLICNSLISTESKDTHTQDLDHLNNFRKCQENKNNYELTKAEMESKDVPNSNTTVEESTAENVDVKESTAENVDVKESTAENVDVKESTAENVDVVEKDSGMNLFCAYIENVILNKTETKNENNNDDEEILTPDEALKRALLFAKENGLNYKRNNTYCKTCNVKISSSLKRMKEHVEEQSHKEKAAVFSKLALKKVPMFEYIDSETVVENIYGHDVLINDTFCLTYLSYQMITRIGQRLRCQACEVTLDRYEVEKHIRSWEHVQVMHLTPVITDIDNEFFREVRSGMYHCGFCNFIENRWKDIKNHLKSVNHNEKKSFAKRRLYKYLPEIISAREERKIVKFIRAMHGL